MKLLINELVPVYETDLGNKVVNGRELHEFLEVGKDFSTWMKDRLEKYGFEDGIDYSLTLTRTGERSNVTRHDYFLQLDAAKEIAMVENNDQGKKVRRYFIEVEKRFKERSAQFALPQNYVQALEALVAAEKDRFVLVEQNAHKDAQLKLQEPKVALYDVAMSAEGAQPVGTVAKELGLGRTRLFALLREKKVLRQNNEPYQEFIERGYFKLRMYTITHKTSGLENKTQPMVTPKGIAWLHKIIKGA